MKKIFFALATCAAFLFVAAACGKSDAVSLDDAVASVDSLAKGVEAPFASVKIAAADKDIKADIVLCDSVISIDKVGEELFDYFMAVQLKSMDVNVINKVLSALNASEGKLILSIKDTFGSDKNFALTSGEIKNLYTGNLSSLNTRESKNQLADMLKDAFPRSPKDQKAELTVEVNGPRIEYIFTFEKQNDYKALLAPKKMTEQAALLGGRYDAALKAQYAKLGVLIPAFCKVANDVKISNIRVIYKAKDTENTVEYPWMFEGGIF